MERNGETLQNVQQQQKYNRETCDGSWGGLGIRQDSWWTGEEINKGLGSVMSYNKTFLSLIIWIELKRPLVFGRRSSTQYTLHAVRNSWVVDYVAFWLPLKVAVSTMHFKGPLILCEFLLKAFYSRLIQYISQSVIRCRCTSAMIPTAVDFDVKMRVFLQLNQWKVEK